MGQLITVLNSTAVLGIVNGVGFDPFFRGLLSVLVAIVVLGGSTYLLVATNVGTRTGFLVAMSAFFGWMFLMGIVWTIYGIGWRGDPPTWALEEINIDTPDQATDGLLYSTIEPVAGLAASEESSGLPEGGLANAPVDAPATLDRITDPNIKAVAEEELASAAAVGDIAEPDVAQEAALVASRQYNLDGWRYLEASDPIRGEAQASADAFLVENGVFVAGEYVPSQFGAFIVDGKPILEENPTMIERVVHTVTETVAHPSFDSEYIVIQAQAAVNQPTLPGQPPPVAEVDTEAPVVSVVMLRDRGGPFPALFSGLRFRPAMFTITCGILFALLAFWLNNRDERQAEIRASSA
ncbi:MAG: hypothetical protein ACK5PP_01015 [Acidimicrobiales bacterium]